MQTYATHILPLTHLRRARLLPVNGNVLVRSGQKVNATDIVAEANLGGEHLLIDVRSPLKLSRDDKLEKIIERRVGDKLKAEDVIAERKGLFRRVVRTPVNGQIVAITSGAVMLEVESPPMLLYAGFNGIVTEIIQDRGVILETSGALIQGIWGNGIVDQGTFSSLNQTIKDELTPQKIDVSLRSTVIMGSYCTQADTLKAANLLPIRGMILGSMSAELIPLAQTMSYPIIVIDGFGNSPMNVPAFELLITNNQRDICLNAAPFDLFSGERPEVVIPLPATGDFSNEIGEIKAGATVRIIGAPNHGKIGTITQLLPGNTQLPNQLRVPAAAIQINNIEIVIPLANLDVLE